MLKVGIIGCGKIADAHASQIQRIRGCELVGVCDREALMAKQLYERFPVRRWFTSPEQLLAEAKPDVVHITTPPASHLPLAKMCLESGSHIYVEKPFTLYAADARTLIDEAQRRGLKVTAGHDDQFSHAARRMRELVRSGYLGDGPIHMESTFCYQFGQAYARALFGDRQHWVRRLPGKLLHNIISHGVARIAEFMVSDSPEVFAHGFVSSQLKAAGETEIIDELRVIISEEEHTTAYFTFSSQMRPSVHEFVIYGSKNGIRVDQDHEIVLKLRGDSFKSVLDKFLPPAIFARQQVANLSANLGAFLKSDFHAKAGMHQLIELFYRSITDGTPVPIPYREIVLTATIMEKIFEQIGAGGVDGRCLKGAAAARG